VVGEEEEEEDVVELDASDPAGRPMLEYRGSGERWSCWRWLGGVLAIPRLLSFSYLVLVTEMGFCTAIARGRG